MPANLVLASVPRFTLIRTASVLSPSSLAASATVTVIGSVVGSVARSLVGSLVGSMTGSVDRPAVPVNGDCPAFCANPHISWGTHPHSTPRRPLVGITAAVLLAQRLSPG